MQNIIKGKDGEYNFTTWIKKRIKNNLNFLAIAEGPTGAGKSWAMLSLAYNIDPTFEIRQVAFSFKEVMDIINADWFKQKKLKVILFDEPQTDISNRTWQSLTNKLMNFLMSTFRHINCILLFATPYSDFIDSQTKKLIHCIFDVRGHSRQTKKTQVRPKLLQWNSKLKKFYEHSLYVIKAGGFQKLSMMYIDIPPQHLIKPYEEKKTAFTTALNKSIQQQLDALALKNAPKIEKEEEKEIGEGKLLINKKPLNPASLQPLIWEEAQQGYKTNIDLAERVGKRIGRVVQPTEISKNKVRMYRKGWDITPFWRK